MKQQYSINNKTLQDYSGLVSLLDGDIERLLNTENLTKKDLNSPLLSIPYGAFIQLVETTAKQLNYPAFGLHLSTVIDLNTCGCLDSFCMKNLSFQEAMYLTQQFLAKYNNCSDCWESSKDQHLLIVSRYDNSGSLVLSVQEKELSYGVFLRVLQKILGRPLKNCRIEFSHNNITDIRVIKKFLKIDVAFNQECERVIIDPRLLNQPIAHINQQRYQQPNNNGLAINQKISLEQRVKNLIMQNMINKTHTIENIANKLNMHPRSLQRRLEEQNLNFKQILNDLRIAVACWHLKASNKSVSLISEILGYNEVSSFSRSFKKHKKCSALQWRKTHAIGV